MRTSDKKQPLVSVIVINWNGEKWLKKCLSSLQAQTYPRVEIILSDNDSTDKSIELVKRNFPDVHVIKNQVNGGFAYGVNKGIESSKGKLLLILNTDTYLPTNAVKDLVQEMLNRKLDVIAPREVPYSKTYNNHEKSNFNIDVFGHPIFEAKRLFYLSGVCLLMSKSTYEAAGGLDNNFFMYVEEVDLFWRLNLLEKSFDYSNSVVIHHAGAGSSGGYGLNKKIFLWRNTNTLQMLIKNYKYSTLVFILPLYIFINFAEILCFAILKPSLVTTYIKPYGFVLKNFRSISSKHRLVRRLAKQSDWEIMKIMYKGSGKPAHIFSMMKGTH